MLSEYELKCRANKLENESYLQRLGLCARLAIRPKKKRGRITRCLEPRKSSRMCHRPNYAEWGAVDDEKGDEKDTTYVDDLDSDSDDGADSDTTSAYRCRFEKYMTACPECGKKMLSTVSGTLKKHRMPNSKQHCAVSK